MDSVGEFIHLRKVLSVIRGDLHHEHQSELDNHPGFQLACPRPGRFILLGRSVLQAISYTQAVNQHGACVLAPLRAAQQPIRLSRSCCCDIAGSSLLMLASVNRLPRIIVRGAGFLTVNVPELTTQLLVESSLN